MAEGSITEEEYMQKLEDFIRKRTDAVKGLNNQYQLRTYFDYAAQFYKKQGKSGSKKATGKTAGEKKEKK